MDQFSPDEIAVLNKAKSRLRLSVLTGSILGAALGYGIAKRMHAPANRRVLLVTSGLMVGAPIGVYVGIKAGAQEIESSGHMDHIKEVLTKSRTKGEGDAWGKIRTSTRKETSWDKVRTTPPAPQASTTKPKVNAYGDVVE